MATDGDRVDGSGGEPRPDNVVRLPPDWLGPRSELVPFGSRASTGTAVEGDGPASSERAQRARRQPRRASGASSPRRLRPVEDERAEVEPGSLPAGRASAAAPADVLSADAFWSEDTEFLHQAIRTAPAKAGGRPAPPEPVAERGGRTRRAAVGRGRLSVAPRALRRLGGIVGGCAVLVVTAVALSSGGPRWSQRPPLPDPAGVGPSGSPAGILGAAARQVDDLAGVLEAQLGGTSLASELAGRIAVRHERHPRQPGSRFRRAGRRAGAAARRRSAATDQRRAGATLPGPSSGGSDGPASSSAVAGGATTSSAGPSSDAAATPSGAGSHPTAATDPSPPANTTRSSSAAASSAPSSTAPATTEPTTVAPSRPVTPATKSASSSGRTTSGRSAASQCEGLSQLGCQGHGS